jgi:hypothetical protein
MAALTATKKETVWDEICGNITEAHYVPLAVMVTVAVLYLILIMVATSLTCRWCCNRCRKYLVKEAENSVIF